MMVWVDQLVASGRIADIAMAFIVIEMLALAFLLHPFARLRILLLTLLSGFCLIGAVSASLTDASAFAVAAWLIGAMVAHVADMATRLARRDR